MAINFPTSPSTNDTFTAGFITYKWDGAKWIGQGVTPETDRLVEGSNSLEINASNNLVWTGGVVEIGNSVDLTDSTVDLYSQTTNSASKTFQLFSDIGGTKTEKVSLTANGVASFSSQVVIGSGSAANSEYGLIAYADSNSTSNKSSVYARNIGGGRNFTGDNSAGATTFEVYSSGTVVLTQSATTSINSIDTLNSGSGDNLVKVRTQANQGGSPYIKFDAGGSNMIVGEYYNGTTNNKLVLGVGENPTSVKGLSIDGTGNGIYGNGHQSTALAVDNSSNRGLNFTTSGRVYCKTNNHWDFNLVGGGLMMRFRNGNDSGSGSQLVVGNITINSNSVDFNTTQSDSRLKKNIEPWTEGVLQNFKTLQPKKFHFNWQSDEDSLDTGYMAQDLVGAFPEAYPLCKTEIDGEEVDRYSFNPSGMVKYLMKALQEEIVKREELEARLDAAGL